MKRIVLIVLVAALLGVTNVALAGYTVYHDVCGHHGSGYYYHPAPLYYVPVQSSPGCSKCSYTDIRLKRAESEKLKASYNYYSLSAHDCDAATAKWMKSEMDSVVGSIEAWLGNKR